MSGVYYSVYTMMHSRLTRKMVQVLVAQGAEPGPQQAEDVAHGYVSTDSAGRVVAS